MPCVIEAFKMTMWHLTCHFLKRFWRSICVFLTSNDEGGTFHFIKILTSIKCHETSKDLLPNMKRNIGKAFFNSGYDTR